MSRADSKTGDPREMTDKAERSARLTRVETNVEALTNDVRSLSGDVRALTQTVGNYITSAGRVNWGWIFAGLGLVISIQFAMNRATTAPLEARADAAERRLEHMGHDNDDTRLLLIQTLEKTAYLRGLVDGRATSSALHAEIGNGVPRP